MKKLLVPILILTLIASTFIFSACDGSILSAEQMLSHCDDQIVLDPLTNVQIVDIQADIYAVAVHNVDSDKVEINFVHHDKVKVDAFYKDGTLRITQESQGWFVNEPKLYLVVGIPQSWTNYQLDVNMDVGALGIEQSNATVLNVDISTGSSQIDVVDAKLVTVDVDTGAVFFSGNADVVTIDTDTGAANVNGNVKHLTVHSDTGAINAEVDCKTLDLSSDTGAINFTVTNNVVIHLESDTGAICGKINQSQELYTITVDVSTGRCNVKDQTGTGAYALTIEVDTGSVNITFND